MSFFGPLSCNGRLKSRCERPREPSKKRQFCQGNIMNGRKSLEATVLKQPCGYVNLKRFVTTCINSIKEGIFLAHQTLDLDYVVKLIYTVRSSVATREIITFYHYLPPHHRHFPIIPIQNQQVQDENGAFEVGKLRPPRHREWIILE